MDGPAMTTSDLASLLPALTTMTPASDDSERIDRIQLLEELKSAVAAAQISETAAFVASQHTAQRAAGVPAARVGRGVAAQVALARRESPARAQRFCGWATILTAELPHTFAALSCGQVTQRRALIVARETAWLSREHRLTLDAELAPQLHGLGDRRIEAAAKRIGYRLDLHGFLERLKAAENERRVSLRPAPDAMARLTALLPVAQGVAAYTALTRAADTTVAGGTDTHLDKPRGRGQIMADTLVQRLTGQTTAPDVPVEITLVMTDHALLGKRTADAAASGSTERGAAITTGTADTSHEPATILGYGPIPASWARILIQRPAPTTPMWIRRLFRHPTTGQLAAMDSRRRNFTPNQRLFLRITADDICTTPWCNAPVRHLDHITRATDGGPTTTINGRGLCAACNHARETPGWTARRTTPEPTGQVITTTPTGHVYRSGAAPGTAPPRSPIPPRSPVRADFVRPRIPVTIDLPRHRSAA